MLSLREELPLTQCELKRRNFISWNYISGNNLAFPKVVWCLNTNSNPLHLAKLHKVMLRSRKALNESCTEFCGSDHHLQNVHRCIRLTEVRRPVICPGGILRRQEHWRVSCTLMIYYFFIIIFLLDCLWILSQAWHLSYGSHKFTPCS